MDIFLVAVLIIGGVYADMYLYDKLDGSHEPILLPLVDSILETLKDTKEPTSTEETTHEEVQSKEEALSS